MANNKIIVSSGNGTYQETTSSFSIDNDNGIISASSAVVATSSLPTNVSGVLQVYKGKVIPLWFTSSIWQNFTDLNADSVGTTPELSGTLFQYRNDLTIVGGNDYNGIGPHRVASASFNGDIIGTISASAPVKVISVANVTGGILDSRFGGTNTSSFENGAIVTLSGSGFKPSDGANNVITADINSNWSLVNKISIEPADTYLTGTLVYLYTGSVNNIDYNALTQSFTWIKPGSVGSLISQKPRFIRVICQGAGGGGARPNIGGAGTPVFAWGGSGGGYSDVTYNSEYISDTVEVSIGKGGRGATTNQTSGGPGGPSLFGNYVSGATGGAGGQVETSATTYPRSGVGYLYLGGSGSQGSFDSSAGGRLDLNSNVVLGGAGGGGGGGWTNSQYGRTGGSITSLNLTASVQPASFLGQNALPPMSGTMFNFTKCILNDVENSNFPFLIYAGGTGGTGASSGTGGSGSSPLFGSGGGGGGRVNTGATGNGGNGGSGYVLIICT